MTTLDLSYNKIGDDGAKAIGSALPRGSAGKSQGSAKHFGIKMPPKVPMVTQERAYTSPIWYTPGK